MRIARIIGSIWIAAFAIAASALPAAAQQPMKIDLSNETVGAEPKSLVPVVGIWRIENDGARRNQEW